MPLLNFVVASDLDSLIYSYFFNKKQIPLYPSKIGLITAPYGAAVQDMMRTIKQRWPIAQVIVFPSLVQGSEAKYDIVKNIALMIKQRIGIYLEGSEYDFDSVLYKFAFSLIDRSPS